VPRFCVVSIDSVLRAIICCVRLRHVRESRQRHQAFLCVFTSTSTLHFNSRVDTNINDDCTYQAAVELCIVLKAFALRSIAVQVNAVENSIARYRAISYPTLRVISIRSAQKSLIEFSSMLLAGQDASLRIEALF
jgi:hypothetical protein